MELMLLVLPDGDRYSEKNIEFLFDVFKRDFIDSSPKIISGDISYLIDIVANDTCDCPFGNHQKPKRFWHIITKKEYDPRKRNNPCPDDPEKNRVFCVNRSKRIHWIRYIIENWQTNEKIVHFYQEKSHRDHRLILWHRGLDFLVIIKKLGARSDRFLVTSYIVMGDKKNRYKKEYKKYEEAKPLGIEWF